MTVHKAELFRKAQLLHFLIRSEPYRVQPEQHSPLSMKIVTFTFTFRRLAVVLAILAAVGVGPACATSPFDSAEDEVSSSWKLRAYGYSALVAKVMYADYMSLSVEGHAANM